MQWYQVCGQVKEGMSHLLRGFLHAPFLAGGKFGPQVEEYPSNAVIRF